MTRLCGLALLPLLALLPACSSGPKTPLPGGPAPEYETPRDYQHDGGNIDSLGGAPVSDPGLLPPPPPPTGPAPPMMPPATPAGSAPAPAPPDGSATPAGSAGPPSTAPAPPASAPPPAPAPAPSYAPGD